MTNNATMSAWGLKYFNPLIADIPEDIRETFTPAQLHALARASRNQRTKHTVDFRVSLPFLGGRRYYLTVLAGRERRSAGRLVAEGHTDGSRILIFYLVLALVMLGFLVFGFLTSIYFTRLLSGLELVDCPSPFNQLFPPAPRH